jgi:hypothetical protein
MMDVNYVDTFDEDPIDIDYEHEHIPAMSDQRSPDTFGVSPKPQLQQPFVNQNLTIESVKKVLAERIRPIEREAPNHPAKKIARVKKPIESICFATYQDYLDYKSRYG